MTRSSPRYRSADERQGWIMLALRTTGFLSVADISRKFGVSHMTVRRDLQHLADIGQVRTVYGGVSLSSETLRFPNRGACADSAAHAARIAACAARVVGETDAIAIDAGDLGYEVARALPEQFRGTVVTHSIPVIQLLVGRSRPPRVVGLGGEVMAERSAFVGATTVAAIAGVRVQTLFLVADAVDDRGAYAHSDSEASVKRALLNIADRTVLLADHQSFDDAAPFLLGTLRKFRTVVTDKPPSDRVARALRSADVRTVVVRDAEEPPGGSVYPLSREG